MGKAPHQSSRSLAKHVAYGVPCNRVGNRTVDQRGYTLYIASTRVWQDDGKRFTTVSGCRIGITDIIFNLI